MASFNSSKKTADGFLLVDVLIGLFIASILTTAFIASVVSAVRYAGIQAKAVQAELLAIELLEVARELETSDWSQLSTGSCADPDSPCHPTISSGAWELVDGAETVGAFTRSLSIDSVERDATFAIAESGTLDLNTKKITADVTWNAYGSPHSLTLQTYVYDHS
jgi:type II secretory pathway pseudopilin PulG